MFEKRKHIPSIVLPPRRSISLQKKIYIPFYNATIKCGRNLQSLNSKELQERKRKLDTMIRYAESRDSLYDFFKEKHLFFGNMCMIFAFAAIDNFLQILETVTLMLLCTFLTVLTFKVYTTTFGEKNAIKQLKRERSRTHSELKRRVGVPPYRK